MVKSIFVPAINTIKKFWLQSKEKPKSCKSLEKINTYENRSLKFDYPEKPNLKIQVQRKTKPKPGPIENSRKIQHPKGNRPFLKPPSNDP